MPVGEERSLLIGIIQKISGHRTQDELYKYLEVSPDQVCGAIAALSMLTPVEQEPAYFEKPYLHKAAREE
ncbi:hypothetical protein [Chroococcidiopsis sp. SAG 2025]|uniref:hypothetical protein n=1 Tax=Chroococcidiopsis sp. SAG 2025 TaxID=171389 RepID=UPI0029370FBC|nr:hypothetical protein [Chroococcidiopsis sp. SAG 2025]